VRQRSELPTSLRKNTRAPPRAEINKPRTSTSSLVGAGERAAAVADERELATDTKKIKASYLVGAGERAAAGADATDTKTI
jgi:hypothetical protein